MIALLSCIVYVVSVRLVLVNIDSGCRSSEVIFLLFVVFYSDIAS